MPAVDSPPTLSDLAVVAGVSRSAARAAAQAGLVNEAALTWLDALLLRVYLSAGSWTLPGERFDPHAKPRASHRVGEALQTTRDAVANGHVWTESVLVVGRRDARLHPHWADAVVQNNVDTVAADPVFVLPLGRWWAELAWRTPPSTRT